jgi:hypothetical protein
MMSRLPVPQRESSPFRTSGSAARMCEGSATPGGTPDRGPLVGLSRTRWSLQWGDTVALRQNAAAMLLEARLIAVRYLPHAATGCVNSYFHWDFPKFNIS